MKRLILLFALLTIATFAQVKDIQAPFSKLDIGIYGGVDLIIPSRAGFSLSIEGKTNILSNLNLKISSGYTKINLDNKYEVMAFRTEYLGNDKYYQAYRITIEGGSYYVIPLVMGAEYIFIQKELKAYALFETAYNWINEEPHQYDETPLEKYDTIDEMPLHTFLRNTDRYLPDESISMGIGMGIRYPISSNTDIDLRWIYQFHDNFASSHKILIGIVF